MLDNRLIIQGKEKFAVVLLKNAIQLSLFGCVYVVLSGWMLLLWDTRVRQSDCYGYETTKYLTENPSKWLARQRRFSELPFLEAEKEARPTLVYVRPVFNYETAFIDRVISNSTSFQAFVSENNVLMLVYNSKDGGIPEVGSLATLHAAYQPRFVVTNGHTSKQFSIHVSANCFELRPLL